VTSLSEAFEAICVMDAPLNARLAAYADKLRELNFPFAEAYDELVGRLIAGEIGTAAPKVGDVMPPFVLPARSGQLVGLEDLLHAGPVVISFNRGHWCPFCKIELRTIAQHQVEIAAIGGQVVSIIPDRQQFAEQLYRDTSGELVILTDIDNGYALSLGLVMWLGDSKHIKEMTAGLCRCPPRLSLQRMDGWPPGMSIRNFAIEWRLTTFLPPCKLLAAADSASAVEE
jgi:peroxiredoxin